jgi:hypothetical protein
MRHAVANADQPHASQFVTQELEQKPGCPAMIQSFSGIPEPL